MCKDQGWCSVGTRERTARLQHKTRHLTMVIQFNENQPLSKEEVELVVKGAAIELLLGKFEMTYSNLYAG